MATRLQTKNKKEEEKKRFLITSSHYVVSQWFNQKYYGGSVRSVAASQTSHGPWFESDLKFLLCIISA